VDEVSPVLTVVLAALAGVRTQHEVALLGGGAMLRRALEAGSGRDLVDEGPADIVVAHSATDVPGAVTMLKPGGWLVAVAADAGAVERTVARHGLVLRHSERVGGRVAWSASLPA
jgi:hypothetical protein